MMLSGAGVPNNSGFDNYYLRYISLSGCQNISEISSLLVTRESSSLYSKL